MWGWFYKGQSKKPNLGTMGIDPDDSTLRPPVGVFVSHRWEDETEFHARVLASFAGCNPPIRDLSLTSDQLIAGPRGGRTIPLRIKLDLADRIRACDIFFVPADKAAAHETWLKYETQKAAEFKKPVVFVSDDWRRQRWNRYAKQLADLKLPTRTAHLDSREILDAARAMLPGRLH